MQYTIQKHIIQVIGKIWFPPITAAMEYTLTDRDLEQYKISKTNPTREQIESWILFNTGDFQSVEDFSANIGDNNIVPWKNEESELTFNDCLFPSEDQ